MTSYLLIDLDKSAVGCVAPTGDTSRVFLFAKKKNNHQIAEDFAAENPQVVFVKVGKDEKLAEVLANKLKKLIKKQPEARFLIDSPRGKVMKAVDKLLNRFPEANVMMLDVAQDDDADEASPSETATQTPVAEAKPQTSKPAAKAAPHPEWQPEKIQLVQPQSNKKPEPQPKKKKIPVSKKPSLLPERAPETLRDNLEKKLLPQQHVLLDKISQNHDKQDKKSDLPAFEQMMSRLDEVIGILTQGYPKKKSVLLNELAQTLNLDEKEAESVLDNLSANGMIKVEHDTVKITNLIHLLKMK